MTRDDQIDAAELALGLLEGADRATALERVLAEPAFAAEVARWRERLAPMFHDVGSVEPPAALAARIAVPESDDVSVRQLRPRRWRAAVGGAVAGALAASAAFLLITSRAAPAPPPVPPPPAVAAGRLFVAALAPTGPDGGAAVLVIVDADARVIRVAPGVAIPAGRTAELWHIGHDGTPRPVGLLDRAAPSRLALGGGTVPAPDETLAISIEPAGGSPTGAPTGPVVAAGKLSAA